MKLRAKAPSGLGLQRKEMMDDATSIERFTWNPPISSWPFRNAADNRQSALGSLLIKWYLFKFLSTPSSSGETGLGGRNIMLYESAVYLSRRGRLGGSGQREEKDRQSGGSVKRKKNAKLRLFRGTKRVCIYEVLPMAWNKKFNIPTGSNNCLSV